MPIFTEENIKEIAEKLDCGYRVFYHRQTGMLLFIPDTSHSEESENGLQQNEMHPFENHLANYNEIKSMEVNEMIQVMLDFTEQLNEHNLLKKRLLNTLVKKNPSIEFKSVIDNSGVYRQEWADFQHAKLIDWVIDQIYFQNQIKEEEEENNP